jgi:hypothetical protein
MFISGLLGGDPGKAKALGRIRLQCDLTPVLGGDPYDSEIACLGKLTKGQSLVPGGV